MSPWTAEFAAWDVWIVSWIVASLWSAPAAARLDWRRQAPNLVVTAAGGVLLFSQQMTSPFRLANLWNNPLWLGWVMVAVSVAGFAFCWWARIHLGRLWSGTVTRKADHRIVDTGPYGIVRHPIYTGLLAAAAGLAVLDASAGALLGFAVVALGLTMKARLEEGFLAEA
ncbi:MAG: isoprenylcysteine carboxylmethyltransferase family protein, partial [Caulobacteraceae bacterium]